MERKSESNTDHPVPPRDLVGSLVKGMQVLEILAAHSEGLSLTEVANEAGLTRAGARRLLLTLVATGHAQQAGRVFRLSPKLLSLARQWIGNASLWQFAEPIMREVSAELGESCSAAILEGEDVVYVARVAGRRIVSVALHVGARLPAFCTSMGRVLLSELEPAELARFLEQATIVANTPKTMTDRTALAAKIVEARDMAYAIVDEELELGLRSLAVPVRDRTGRIIAALNVSTQAARFSCREMENDILPVLKGAAGRIETFLALQ